VTLLARRPVAPSAATADVRRVLTALFAAGLATFALIYSPQALLPELSSAFDISAAQSSLAVSATTFALAVALLVAGTLSEVVGRTPLIHVSLVASAVVAGLCAVAPSWPVLLGLRVVEGLLLAGLPAVATAYLREELPAAIHGRAAGLYIGGTALGGMVGRLLPGGVADLLGWRWALGAVALLALACAVVVRLLLPPSRHFRPANPGLRSLGRMTRGAVSDRGLLALYAVGGCGVGAFMAVSNALGFRLTSAPFDLGVGAASLVFVAYPLGSLAAMGAGRLADRWGRARVLPLGVTVALGGVLLTLPAGLPWMAVGFALVIAGFFVVHSVASGWVPARAHAQGVGPGQAASLYLFSFYIASSVAGTVAAAAWTSVGWSGVVALSSALLLVSAVLAGVLRARSA
jgi:YNFM family putative membrane transporter